MMAVIQARYKLEFWLTWALRKSPAGCVVIWPSFMLQIPVTLLVSSLYILFSLLYSYSVTRTQVMLKFSYIKQCCQQGAHATILLILSVFSETPIDNSTLTIGVSLGIAAVLLLILLVSVLLILFLCIYKRKVTLRMDALQSKWVTLFGFSAN